MSDTNRTTVGNHRGLIHYQQQQQQQQQHASTAATRHLTQQQQQHASTVATRRQSVDDQNTVVAAFLVENEHDRRRFSHYYDDDDDQRLTQREQEVVEQEIRLAEQEEKLRAWEEELEHKKRDYLESYSRHDIVQAEIMSVIPSQPPQQPSSPSSSSPPKQKQSRKSFTVNRLLPKFASIRTFTSSHNNSAAVAAAATVAEETSAAASKDDDDDDGDDFVVDDTGPEDTTNPLVVAAAVRAKPPQDEIRMRCCDNNLDFHLANTTIGDGPLRFANRGPRRSLNQQIQDLSRSDRICYKNLLQRWEDRRTKMTTTGTGTGTGTGQYQYYHLPNEECLRFARNNTKKDGSFCEERAWKWMRKFNQRYLGLSTTTLKEQLLSKTLFPVPGLMTKAGHDMFYMKPARYVPKETSTQSIIDNLAYVMNTMLERERPCTEGIGFLANMDAWAMKNFDVNYCYQFMMTLQGFVVPVRVQLFLIVNPPSWFGVIWKIMKGMLAPSFRRKVKMIGQDKLAKYLQEGFETYLPDDMEIGQADTTALVEDFVTLRKYLETTRNANANANATDQFVSTTSHHSDRVSMMDPELDTTTRSRSRRRSSSASRSNNPSVGTHGSSHHPWSETDSVLSALDHHESSDQIFDDDDDEEASIDGDLSFDSDIMACDDFEDVIMAEVQTIPTPVACASDL
jgi:hypothetical protein